MPLFSVSDSRFVSQTVAFLLSPSLPPLIRQRLPLCLSPPRLKICQTTQGLDHEGLHLNDDPTESGNHSSPSPKPHIQTSPSPKAIQLAGSPQKRKKKIDHTEVIEVSVRSDNTLLPSNKCSNKCTYYFWQMNDEKGVNWKKMIKKTKNFYWGEFQKYITNPGFSEE